MSAWTAPGLQLWPLLVRSLLTDTGNLNNRARPPQLAASFISSHEAG